MRLKRLLLTFGTMGLSLALAGCAAAAAPVPPPPPAAGAADTANDATEMPVAAVDIPAVADNETPAQGLSPQPGPAPSVSTFAPAAIGAVIDGDFVTVPLAAVEDAGNARFDVTLGDRLLDFMAYTLDGELYVRASACPPCESRRFTLEGETLVCESCWTQFDAFTGEGIDGACVDYPKAEVRYETAEGVVTMRVADLVRAYDETLQAGSGPLVEVAVAPEPTEPVDTRPACCR